jgi:hypothetical protein
MRVSFGLLASAALAVASLSSVFSGCASGTSAITPTFDAGSPGDDDDQHTEDDDDDGTADASTSGAEAGGSTSDAATTDAASASDAASDAASEASAPTTCAGALALAQYTFDDGPQGWTHGISDGQTGTWPYDPWTQGVATNKSPACPSGSCFGAELTENYAQCQRGYLLSPPLDLSTCAGQDLHLNFQQGYVFWDDGTFFDGGVVFVSADGGATWTALSDGVPGTVVIQQNIDTYQCTDSANFEVDGMPGYTGSSATGADTVQLTIPSALVTARTLIKFSMGSGVSSPTDDAGTSRLYTGSGWRIDNVGLAMVAP